MPVGGRLRKKRKKVSKKRKKRTRYLLALGVEGEVAKEECQ